MAELLFGLAENLLIKLSSTVCQEISSAYGVHADLKVLATTISTIKAVISDAEIKKTHSNEMSIWLNQLQEVLYDVEDVFDEFEYEALHKKLLSQWRTNIKVCCFFPMHFHKSVLFHFNMAHRIKEITRRLDEIASRRHKFHLEEKEVEYFSHTIREMTHSFIHDSEASQVFGRDRDRERIIQLLTQSKNSEELSIISLVGMGGLGKTTLAKLVCNDQRVKEYFEKKIWICVSTDFDVQRLTREILDSAVGSEISQSLSMDQLQSKLREQLVNRRFLLVLDDVWNEKANRWRDLRQFLMVGAMGSTILVTTRMDSVASIMGCDAKHELTGISKKDSWTLFSKFAFADGKEKEIREDLKRIGEEILEKCKGVPLAIKSLGSLLYSKSNTREWEYIRDSEIWQIEDKEDGILPALKLSYTLMPSYLKPCFVYCALFPKDYVYSYRQIIPLWMSQGMLCSKNEKEELEDIGERYFKELCSRSFFQDFRSNLRDSTCRFKMHDLLHDLALSIVQGKYLIIDSDTKKVDENVQHLYFSDSNSTIWSPTQPLQRVRSIAIFKRDHLSVLDIFKCFTKFKFLRVLELDSQCLRSLPNSIGKLKHLRYLNLGKNPFLEGLPNSICQLHNLQTLILQECWLVRALPRHLGNMMISLRYLSVSEVIMSLLLKVVGIEYLLSNLRYLAISYSPSSQQDINEDVINKGIVIQPKLKTLNLENVSWEALPQWLRIFTKTLRQVRIIDCFELLSLSEWLLEVSSLETLEIVSCIKLSSLPQGMENLTSLTKLRIILCEDLSMRCNSKFSDQWCKIAHVPEVIVDFMRINK